MNTILLIFFSHLFSHSLNLQALYEFLLAILYVHISPKLYMVSEPTSFLEKGTHVSYLKVHKGDTFRKYGLFVDNTFHSL
jgi:hypothetical protein